MARNANIGHGAIAVVLLSLASITALRRLNRSGRSNGVPHISHKDVESLPIHVPPLAEQQRVVDSLEVAELEFKALAHMQARTRTELDALLPAVLDRAFAGAK